jgi:hypothetical protein
MITVGKRVNVIRIFVVLGEQRDFCRRGCMKSHIHISLEDPYRGVHDTVCDELITDSIVHFKYGSHRSQSFQPSWKYERHILVAIFSFSQLETGLSNGYCDWRCSNASKLDEEQ